MPSGEDDWEEYRSVRLAALRESPEAFVATLDEEEAFDEDFWRDRMRRSAAAGRRAGRPARSASSASVSADDGRRRAKVAELFGLWVRPEARGTGVATAARPGRRRRGPASDGARHLAYWVGTDNGRAVAFASGFGFRPTDSRRPMRVVSEEDGEEEIAMVLPLGDDRGAQPRPAEARRGP